MELSNKSQYICEGVKEFYLKDNEKPYLNMPVYIRRNFHSEYAFLLIFILLASFFYFLVFLVGDGGVKEGIIFFSITSIILSIIFIPILRHGTFVLSADDNGIYYKVIGKSNDFVLIEWSTIYPIGVEDDEYNYYLEFLIKIKQYDIPTPSNAIIHKSKLLKIQFRLPPGINAQNTWKNLMLASGRAKEF